MNYNKKTILDYVCGNDLEFNDNELEDNYNFMLDVLKFTRDNKILKLCSARLLNDANFIYNVMQIFRSNKVFCIKLANHFILNNPFNYDINVINVALLASDINNNSYEDELEPVYLYLDNVYDTIKTRPEKMMKKVSDFKFNFGLVQNNFSNNYLFIEFMASNMLKELYYNLTDNNLEYYVKSRYNSPRYIESMGVVQYILNVIRAYDEDLAGYVEFHQGLIKNKIIELTNIIKEWKIQIYDIEDEIYKLILNYSEEHPEVGLDVYIKYIANSLNMNSLLDYTSESINDNLVLNGYETIEFNNKYIYEADDTYKNILLGNLKKEILVYMNNHSLFKEKNKKAIKRKIVSFSRK